MKILQVIFLVLGFGLSLNKIYLGQIIMLIFYCRFWSKILTVSITSIFMFSIPYRRQPS